jgi:quercetin dioxygenase-like cupin family protein
MALAFALLTLTILSIPSATTSRRAGLLPADIIKLMTVYGADAAAIDRAARDYKLPDQIEWKGRPGSGSQSAILFGDPSKPGLYVQLLKREPNNWSQPHSHPNDRFITVLAGTMWIGTGAKFDPENTVPLKPGSYVRDIANQTHFDGSKADGLTIEIVGIGPATSAAAEAK